MITSEMLSNDAVLGTLTDEQRAAIVTMSRNDEEVVIGNRFREVYNQLDDTIARSTGIARNGDEKTYLYLERAAKALAAKANSVDGLNAKVSELTKERDRLQKTLTEGGGDETLKKQLSQAQKDLASVTKQYTDLQADFTAANKRHEAELLGVHIDNELAVARGGVKMKPELPVAVTDAIMRQVVDKVKGMSPEYIDDGNGGRRLVFKGGDGAVLRNPEKQLEPYTAGDLLVKELKAMGVVDEGRKAAGTGTQPPSGTSGGGVPVDITSARTQTEAQDIIARQLMRQGLVNGSRQFQDAMTKAWKDNNVSALPVQ